MGFPPLVYQYSLEPVPLTMKRVGNRPGQIVRSASRRNKTASRFQFDILVISVSGLRPKTSYAIKWSRGVKEDSTNTFTVPSDGGGKQGVEVGQTMSLAVTLYREEGKNFDPKEAKISVVPVGPKRTGKPVAKARFDLSQYAGVPSKTTPEVINASDKIALRTTITSRFLKAGTSGPGSEASSAVSGLSGIGSEKLSDEDDDFGDLLLDDVPEPELEAKHVPKPTISTFKPTNPPPSKPISPLPSAQRPSVQRNLSGGVSSTASEDAHRTTAPSPTVTMRRSNSPKSTSPHGYNRRERAFPTSNSIETIPVAKRSSADEALFASLNTEKDRLTTELEQIRRKLADVDAERHKKVDELTAKVTQLVTEADESSRQRDQLRAEHRRERTELQRQLEERVRQVGEMRALRDSGDKAQIEMKEENEELHRSVEELKGELEIVKNSANDSKKLEARQVELEQSVDKLKSELALCTRERDSLSSKASRLQSTEAKCTKLSREVDRLTLLAASAKGSDGGKIPEEVERRILTLQSEKEALEKKRNALEAHTKEIGETYAKLKDLYDNLCESNEKLKKDVIDAHKAHKIELKRAVEEATANAVAAAREVVEDPVVKDDDEKNILVEELEQARQQLREMNLNHEALLKDQEEAQFEIKSLQSKLDGALFSLEESEECINNLYKEIDEMKDQRDKAMHRALSKRRDSSSNSDNGAAKAAEELRNSKERFGKEQEKFAQRIKELEGEISDLRDDLEFEKSEKAKAREERDKIRESARALERRTSQAARVTDAMHTMRRQLSAHQVREQDHESMIAHLKEEVSGLRAERDEAKRIAQSGLAPNGEEIQEVLNALVVAKLALAEAQSEKQQLEFRMRQLRKNENSNSNRLVGEVSRLEEELAEVRGELDRLRKQQSPKRTSDASEFNDLGSDVDY